MIYPTLRVRRRMFHLFMNERQTRKSYSIRSYVCLGQLKTDSERKIKNTILLSRGPVLTRPNANWKVRTRTKYTEKTNLS